MPDKAKVLIVEDEFLLALQLEDILHDAGHSVIATLADRAALDGLGGALDGARLCADIALVDLNLRDGLTGPDVARQLCERFGTRVIYVTANPGQIGDPASGAVGVVQKPFHREAILAAIQYVLAGCPEAARPAALERIGAPH
ncbi:response regulator [Novosphingobium sp. 1949]|uniref:Response regulator n=1 Tax=Novosphingobium organovorum TaxID=2930092 RepID=A0ABT0BG16_9SPHN|nr:response regulator [Novosphingobium organovorum]MCJ2183997.1 response regulator [Novosphingobium organovorum]